jgi:hypothetical protein
MNQNRPRQIENDIQHAEYRHPVNFIEPIPNGDESIQRTYEVLGRIFGWVARGSTVEQKGLYAFVVLYCVCADLSSGPPSKNLAFWLVSPQRAVETSWRIPEKIALAYFRGSRARSD